MYHPLDYMYLRRDERYGLVYIKRDIEREDEYKHSTAKGVIKWRQRYMFKALHVWCHNSRLGHEIFCLVRNIGVYEYLEWLHHL